MSGKKEIEFVSFHMAPVAEQGASNRLFNTPQKNTDRRVVDASFDLGKFILFTSSLPQSLQVLDKKYQQTIPHSGDDPLVRSQDMQ